MSRKFTKEEAQRVFSLAAERQQAKEREDSNQLSINDLEEAGRAAGIDPSFIRAAASDLLRPDRITDERKFFGFPVEFRESHVLSLEFDEENWKKSVDIFSQVYGRPGRTRQIGTTKRWSSERNDNQMPALIIAEKEEDGTRFTIERKTWPLTLGFGIGALVNLLVGVIFFSLALFLDGAGDLIIPASILAGVGLMLGLFGNIGIKMYSRQELKRFTEVFTHLENMAADQLGEYRELQAESESEKVTTSIKSGPISLSDFPENDTTDHPPLKPRERA